MAAYLSLLREHRDFAKLWSASVVSLLGDWFNTIVLVALIAKFSDGSALAVSAFLLARVLAPLILSPYAGVLADRLDRKKLMIASDLLRAVVVLFLLVASAMESLLLIYILTILQFSLTAVFEPARSAITPSLVPHDKLVLANILGSITWSVMLAVGAITGGIVAAFFGTSIVLLIDALTFFVSAILVMQIQADTRPGNDETTTSDTTSQRGFLDGLRYARQNPVTAAALLVKAGGAVGDSSVMMVIFATQLFVIGDNGEQSLGILYAATGLGAVLGPLVLNRLNDGEVSTMQRLIVIGFVWLIIGWLVLSFAPSLWVVGLALGIRAMGGSANWTYSSVILQKSTADAYLGRVFSLDNMVYQLTVAISTVMTGALVSILGEAHIHQAAIILSIVNIIPLVLWILLMSWTQKPVTRMTVTLSHAVVD